MKRSIVAFAALSLLLSACGVLPDRGGGAPEGGTTPPASPSPSPTPEPTDEPDSVVRDLDSVSSATVRIVAEGTFVDPEFGLQLNVAGSGSGFIVDPGGIAVTNNHVVTGSALLRVFVGGETEPRNARILGYSECSDLAVIDIDGDGYRYLEWFEGDIRPGLDVYTAGYPLGDPEFTLTRGIVSKARADGNTDWASVNSVIEHDATINPGNSGGPLVTADGQVVGINYAGASQTSQYFAISAAEAIPLLDRLRAGENVNSIGVNGQAVTDGEGLSGVWVAAVASGSPADQTRIQPGDIITRMEGLVLATDGTMSDFCDILRSRDTFDIMSVEVLRFQSEEVLTGQLNGNPLEQSFSFAQEVAPEVQMDSTAASYTNYVTITDDTGAIAVEVPAEWSDIDGAPFEFEGNRIFDVRAASDLQAFQTTWTTPGVIVTASQDLARTENEESLLDLFAEGFAAQCTYEGRFPYSDPLYTGQYDLFVGCGGVGATYVIVGAVPADRSSVIAVQIQANDERDFEALDRVLASFVFVP